MFGYISDCSMLNLVALAATAVYTGAQTIKLPGYNHSFMKPRRTSTAWNRRQASTSSSAATVCPIRLLFSAHH